MLDLRQAAGATDIECESDIDTRRLVRFASAPQSFIGNIGEPLEYGEEDFVSEEDAIPLEDLPESYPGNYRATYT